MALPPVPPQPALLLTPTIFQQKYLERFADNDQFQVDEEDLREQARDVASLLLLWSKLGQPLLLSNLDELATVDQRITVVGQSALVANATDSGSAATGVEAGEAEFILRKDSTGPLWAYMSVKSSARVRVRWLPVGDPNARPEFLPYLQLEDYPYKAGDAFKFEFAGGQTIPLQARRDLPLPGAGIMNPLPTGEADDPNYLPLAPLVSSLPGAGFSPQAFLDAFNGTESDISGQLDAAGRLALKFKASGHLLYEANQPVRSFATAQDAINAAPFGQPSLLVLRQNVAEELYVNRPVSIFAPGIIIGGLTCVGAGTVRAQVGLITGPVVANNTSLELVANVVLTTDAASAIAVLSFNAGRLRMRGDITLNSATSTTEALVAGLNESVSLDYEGTIIVTNRGRPFRTQGARSVIRGRVLGADVPSRLMNGWADMYATFDSRGGTQPALEITQNAAFSGDQHHTLHSACELLSPDGVAGLKNGNPSVAQTAQTVGTVAMSAPPEAGIALVPLTPASSGGATENHLTIDSTASRRVFALKLTAPVRLLGLLALSADNASGATFQVAKWNGTAYQGLGQHAAWDAASLVADLAGVTSADRAAGARLEINTTAIVAANPATITLCYLHG